MLWDTSSASGLTVTTMTVSPTKREPPFGAGTPGGGFLFLGMVNLTFGIPDLSIPDSPQKSSAVQKVYRAGLATEGRPVFVQPLSLTPFDSSPSRGASGETVHFAGTAKASPFGRGVTEGDGEGKDAAKQLLHSDSIALTKNLLIAAQKLFCPGLALSVSLRSPAPPKGEPLACRSSFYRTGKAQFFALPTCKKAVIRVE